MIQKISNLALLIAIVIVSQSCNKLELRKDHHHGKHTETKETTDINVSLKYGEVYTYTLPTNQSDDPYQITTQATHFTTSELNTAQTIYTYTAANAVIANSYTDNVTIANVEEAHTDNENHGGGQCGGNSGSSIDNEIERTINIHFTVGDATSSAKTTNTTLR